VNARVFGMGFFILTKVCGNTSELIRRVPCLKINKKGTTEMLKTGESKRKKIKMYDL